MASTLTSQAALGSHHLTGSATGLGAKSSGLQLASPIWGRQLSAAKAPTQRLKSKASGVTASIEWKEVAQAKGLKTISVADGGQVVGTNSAGEPFYRDGDKWTRFKTGILKQMSSGKRGVWGVSSDNKVWTWTNNAWVEQNGTLKHISSGKEVWGIAPDNSVWKRNFTKNDWTKVPGGLMQIDTNDFGDVWGVNTNDNTVWHMVGESWVKIPGPGGVDKIKHVSTGVMGVWAVDKDDHIYRWVWSDSKDGVWFEEPTGRLKYIDSGFDSVWGLSSDEKIWKYLIAL